MRRKTNKRDREETPMKWKGNQESVVSGKPRGKKVFQEY